jgi:hypothetical protein
LKTIDLGDRGEVRVLGVRRKEEWKVAQDPYTDVGLIHVLRGKRARTNRDER